MRFIDIYTNVYLFNLNSSSSRVWSTLNVKVTHEYLVYAVDERENRGKKGLLLVDSIVSRCE